VSITAAGSKQLRALDAVIEEIQTELLAPLSPAEQKRFKDFLRRVAAAEQTAPTRA
jgi:DNA-binding MarR family transcriptional regulator